MKIQSWFWLSMIALTLPSAQSFASATVLSNDSDLSPKPSPVGRQNVPQQIPADSIRTISSEGSLTIHLVREDHGKESTVEGLPEPKVHACSRSRGKARVEVFLQNNWYQVGLSSHPYTIFADVPCTGTHELLFRQSSNGGQALGIWQVAEKARRKLEHEIGLDFWKSRIDFEWPSVGDFYAYGSVNLTHGDAWDVVGHEMGHAIYDLGGIGNFAGGEHKIDECYSATLALSEGWASYFSAWVSVDLGDPDAKFEYMVPRRAPIRFETIPSDVCKGENNEWRVTGFFWDLNDTHNDGETAAFSFAQTWKALAHTRVSSTAEARSRLEAAGLGRENLSQVWKLNFLTEP